MSEANIDVRVQYKRAGGWFTIDDAGEASLVLAGDIVDLLARWVGWFEATGQTNVKGGLCGCCLRHVAEQGHAPDCLYKSSVDLLGEKR